MVCVAVKGVPIIGVIHKPFPPVQTYWAIVGYGHSKNLDVAKKSEDAEEKSSTGKKLPTKIVVSRSHAGSVRNLTEQILGSKQSFEINTAAGAGYKVLEVIKGNADAYLHVTNIKKWDLCAGNAILNALEGTMVTLNGEKLDYSPDTDPMNSKGILAYMKSSELSDKFKESPLYIEN
jgi:inositol monophosphatase 3